MEWIATKDRLPEDKERVLIWYDKADMDGYGRWKPGVYMGYYIAILNEFRPIGGNGNFMDNITHWMPLPEPPHNNRLQSTGANSRACE